MAKNQRDTRAFEDVSSFSSKSQYNKSQKAKKRPHRGLKVFLSIICVFLILIGAGVIYASTYLFGGLTTNKITKDKEALGIASGVISHPQITNIALFGLDSRDATFEGRADAVMVLSIDQIHNKLKLTSILRDSRVFMGDDYPNTDSGYDKINHSYIFGGPERAIKALNLNFGLNITDYVTVNFSKLSAIVDALDGVDINVTESEVKEINKNLDEIIQLGLGATDADYMEVYGGERHLDGAQAVAYAHIRDLDSDNARAGRQQIVMTALMNKIPNIPATQYPSVVNQLMSQCETSLNVTSMLSYAPMALSGFSIERLVVPGADSPSGIMENGGWMWTYDLEAAATQIAEFIYEDAVPDTAQ